MMISAIVIAMFLALLLAGLSICGYFLYLFRKDQLLMRKALRGSHERLRQLEDATRRLEHELDAARRQASLHIPQVDDDTRISQAIRQAREGASVEQLQMAFDLKPSEAAIIVSTHGNLSTEERQRLDALYLA